MVKVLLGASKADEAEAMVERLQSFADNVGEKVEATEENKLLVCQPKH